MPASSMPMATGMPCAWKRLSGARPLFSRKLELQLWHTRVPVCAQSSMSASVIHTPWPSVRRGPVSPTACRCANAEPPVRVVAYSRW